MKAWLVVGALVAVAGVGAGVLLPRNTAAPPAADVVGPESGGLHPPLAAPAEPAPLPAVVEVTDLAPLLDPPPPPADPTPARGGVIAVGYDDPAPAVAPPPRPADPSPIPPAAD